MPLISKIQIIPEKHGKEKTVKKWSCHSSRESMLKKKNGRNKCCERQMVTEGCHQKESRPQIRNVNVFAAVRNKPLEGFSFKKGFQSEG